MKIPVPHRLLYVLLFSLLFLLLPQTGYMGDFAYWTTWATHIKTQGLGKAYLDPSNNYNPVYQYMLWVFGALVGRPEKILVYQFWLKLFPLLFDFAGALLLAWWLPVRGDANQRFMLSLLLLFNVGYLFNTLAWGQVDAIFSCFGLLAILLALRGHLTWSVVAYVLAFNSKTQALVFLPPLLLLWVPAWAQARRGFGVAVGAAVGAQALLMLPFLLAGTGPQLLRVYLGVTNIYPTVSMNAYNLWVLLFGGAALRGSQSVPDSLLFAGLAYRYWGLLLFAGFSGVALLPLFALAVRNWLTRKTTFAASPNEWALVLLSFALIPLFFTYFNTQMHERYWHPALLPMAGYAFLTSRYGLFVLLSVAYFLHLEGVLHSLPLRHGILPFSSVFLASLFTLTWAWGLVELYRLAHRLGVLRQVRAAWAGAPPSAA